MQETNQKSINFNIDDGLWNLFPQSMNETDKAHRLMSDIFSGGTVTKLVSYGFSRLSSSRVQFGLVRSFKKSGRLS